MITGAITLFEYTEAFTRAVALLNWKCLPTAEFINVNSCSRFLTMICRDLSLIPSRPGDGIYNHLEASISLVNMIYEKYSRRIPDDHYLKISTQINQTLLKCLSDQRNKVKEMDAIKNTDN